MQGIDLTEHLQPVLAGRRVRYVGEPVAVVLATDPYLAEDAAELVQVAGTPGPAALDAVTAADDPSAVVADFALGYGDVQAAFAAADQVVELTFDVGRHSAVPLEPRALIVDIDPAARHLDIFGGTKVPVFNQGVLASMLGRDPADIRSNPLVQQAYLGYVEEAS